MHSPGSHRRDSTVGGYFSIPLTTEDAAGGGCAVMGNEALLMEEAMDSEGEP